MAHGIVVAGLHTGCGKTVATSLIAAGLRSVGLEVQPYKIGPDFIDPGFLSLAAGRVCRNLDRWLMGAAGIRREARQSCPGRVAVAEGMMGLFDGACPDSDWGSSVDVARLLGWPVVLVVTSDTLAGRSLAAAIRGFVEEASEVEVSGLILARVAGEGHEKYLRRSLPELALPIWGCIPMRDDLKWPERHLGLQSSTELTLPSSSEFARIARDCLDLDALAKALEPLPPSESEPTPSSRGNKRIALARDQAFHFYYEANLDFLRRRSEVAEFSPLHDGKLPEGVDGVVFGGGFPEVYAEKLSANQGFFEDLRGALESGVACYAECGGLMLLCEELATTEGESFPMAGIVPGRVEMTSALQNFGYCTARTPGGESLRGHEFHYSRWTREEESANLWQVEKLSGGRTRREGYRATNLHASYVHLYWPASQEIIGGVLGLGSPSGVGG